MKHISWKCLGWRCHRELHSRRTFKTHVSAKNSVFVSADAPSGRKKSEMNLFNTSTHEIEIMSKVVFDTWWSSWRGVWCCGWFERRATPRVDSAAASDHHPCVLLNEDTPEPQRNWESAETVINRCSSLIIPHDSSSALKLHVHNNTRTRECLSNVNYPWSFSTGCSGDEASTHQCYYSSLKPLVK